MPRKSAQKSTYLLEFNCMGMIVNKFRLDPNGGLIIPAIAKLAITKRRRRGELLKELSEESSDSMESPVKPFTLPTIEQEPEPASQMVTIKYKDHVSMTQVAEKTIVRPSFDDFKTFFEKITTNLYQNPEMEVPEYKNQYNIPVEF